MLVTVVERGFKAARSSGGVYLLAAADLFLKKSLGPEDGPELTKFPVSSELVVVERGSKAAGLSGRGYLLMVSRLLMMQRRSFGYWSELTVFPWGFSLGVLAIVDRE